MTHKKITELTENTSPAPTDLLHLVDDPSGSPSNQKVQVQTLLNSYVRTAAEVAAGVVPTNYEYEPGNVLRYGCAVDGVTDDATGFQAAIDQMNSGGSPVLLAPGNMVVGSTRTIYSGTKILGVNPTESRITYTGSAQMFVQSAPGTRIYDLVFRDFYINDTGTGTICFDLDSVSTSQFDNILVNGFTTSFKVYSPTSGYSVYNRFYNCTAQNATTGFWLTGTSSNANTLLACRANVAADGVLIDDSNENHINMSQLENCTRGVKITASVAGISPRNYVSQCRFESNTEDWNIGTDVTDTCFIMNHYVDNDVTYTDSGTRTQLFEVQGDASLTNLTSSLVSTDGTPWTYERDVSGGSNVPMVIFRDSVTSTGTPTTVQIETERGVGHAIRVMKSSTEAFGVTGNGLIRTNQGAANTNTPSGATAYAMPIYNESGTLLGYMPVYASQW